MRPDRSASWRDNPGRMPFSTAFGRSGGGQLPAGWPGMMAARRPRGSHLLRLKTSSTGISSRYVERWDWVPKCLRE